MKAIGWTGQWNDDFTAEKAAVHVRAGVELIHLRLLPGERIRMPRIMLLFWRGPDWVRAHNLLRSFILEHHTPRPGGDLPRLPIAAIPWFQFDTGNKGLSSITGATESLGPGINPGIFVKLNPNSVASPCCRLL
jgi:alpha-galactosidase